MIPLLKINKSIVTYTLIFLIVLPLFGFNFFVSLITNFLLLLFLIPLLLFLVIYISFNFLKSEAKTCDQCGTISIGLNNTCTNCGAELDITLTKKTGEIIKPSETTIEIKAEEIK